MKSTEFLQAAINVQAERGKQYDKPTGERSMGATISAFNCITGYTLEESDGWMLLGLLKLVRQSQNPEQYHHDSALDFVAYASLYAESASEQCGQLEAEQPSHIISDIPSWDDAPEWAEFLAQDKSGVWYFYQFPVVVDEDWWVEAEGFDGKIEELPKTENRDNWRTSLQSRPARTAQ